MQIVTAARAQFMRYGYAKTTMGDIAAEAGVSRQTLYNMFANKVEVMRVVVRCAGETSLQQITAAWGDATTLDEKLALFQTLGPVAWYQEIRSAPDWADLMEGMHAAATEEMAQMERVWRDRFVKLFAQYAPGQAAAALQETADFFYMASLNAKHGATDLAHLKRRLDTTRKATLALLQADAELATH